MCKSKALSFLLGSQGSSGGDFVIARVNELLHSGPNGTRKLQSSRPRWTAPPCRLLGFPPAVLGVLSKTSSPLGRGVDGSVSSFLLCIGRAECSTDGTAKTHSGRRNCSGVSTAHVHVGGM
jgi:hypothetical protein